MSYQRRKKLFGKAPPFLPQMGGYNHQLGNKWCLNVNYNPTLVNLTPEIPLFNLYLPPNNFSPITNQQPPPSPPPPPPYSRTLFMCSWQNNLSYQGAQTYM